MVLNPDAQLTPPQFTFTDFKLRVINNELQHRSEVFRSQWNMKELWLWP